MNTNMSPMMRQYLEIKKQNPNTILFFRLGDFYEMFFEDAKLASKELELTLTGRDCGQEERAPMCGVPYHSCEAYIARLVAKGYRVAICEQMEDPATAKGLVKRDVVRVITPGTVTENSMLDESNNNFLCTLSMSDQVAGLCFADISTGEMHVTELAGEDLILRIQNELGRFVPKEILLDHKASEEREIIDFITNKLNCVFAPVPADMFDRQACVQLIEKHFHKSMDQMDLKGDSDQTVGALGVTLQYLYDTQKSGLERITDVDYYSEAQFMRLDLNTRRNLELVETMRAKEKKGSLLWVLDHTKTAMGKRLIRSWIEQPLVNGASVCRRLNAVEELVANTPLREELSEMLEGIFDMERLMTRIVYGTANARDLRAMSKTFQCLPGLKKSLSAGYSAMLTEIRESIDGMEDMYDLIERAIEDDPPVALRDGGIIRKGYSDELDELRSIHTSGRDIIAKIESEEKEKTGIKNLKVGFNKVFGYYLEVTKSNLSQVPPYYVRKQTLVNSERYITQELKDLEGRILGAQERSTALEYQLYESVRKEVAGQLARVEKTASAIAKLDVLCSFAQAAFRNHYCRPDITMDGKINIKEGRHPVVEAMLKDVPFVPNDTFLDGDENRVAIITGPNMAGKSTYMRQTALIVLMAQIGSFVPATTASVGIVDSIFTRVGASDDLTSGQSTFMVEMNEVAHILKYATRDSLLILDEIGRGTSTYDGMSIARAVLEYVADTKKLGAKTLFATHYHELTEMEQQYPGVRNYNIAVKKRGDDITFLRRIVPGGADDSYGIEVAKLSGIPDDVIVRAKQILKQLEETGHTTGKKTSRKAKAGRDEDTQQISLVPSAGDAIATKLKSIDVNTLTPIEALNVLYELNKMANS
ncbi:DNA mismatch repair protein MutS [Solibaculum mannosilyticum]|uniref:DNA mismatch repair protein MutS n=2 Tax=Solibaculum mannosilyticum TaxID=2780922 RepID=A0A7I8D0L5_9FIRM|nr:DNA mismatch repair protein MutS [Solibaculum mannosilyticum]